MNENEKTGATAADWDNWDDIDLSDLKDDEAEESAAAEEAEEADQPEATEAEGAGTEEAAGEEEKGTDQTFTLKHLDEVREVTRDEVIALAQKGMDYDRIRQKLEDETASREALIAEKAGEAERFLQELADREKITVAELMDNVRAEVLAQTENIDISLAKERVKIMKEREALEKERTALQAGSAKDEERQQAINAFVEAYPGVEGKDIPREVWQEFERTGDLIGAYRADENRKLKEQIEALNQQLAAQQNNQKNKKRSTGSQSSDGADKTTDPIVSDWYNGS